MKLLRFIFRLFPRRERITQVRYKEISKPHSKDRLHTLIAEANAMEKEKRGAA